MNALSGPVLNMDKTVLQVLREPAYKGAFCVELTRASIPFDRQKVYPLCYKGEYISGYIADLGVNDQIIIELKSIAHLIPVMEAQLLNYLKLSRFQVGYTDSFLNNYKLHYKIVGISNCSSMYSRF
jgi:GxxExxY protein